MSTEYTEKLGGYPVHPEASKYPMMDGERLQALADDIKENGQYEPILLASYDISDPDGLFIMDGRNRFAACELAGVDPIFREIYTLENSGAEEGAVEITPANVGQWIDAHNLHRRHLTPDQYRQLSTAEKREAIAASLKAEPEKSNRQHAAKFGVDHKTVGKVRKAAESTGEIPQAEVRVSADGRTRPAKSKTAKPLDPEVQVEMANDIRLIVTEIFRQKDMRALPVGAKRYLLDTLAEVSAEFEATIETATEPQVYEPEEALTDKQSAKMGVLAVNSTKSVLEQCESLTLIRYDLVPNEAREESVNELVAARDKLTKLIYEIRKGSKHG